MAEEQKVLIMGAGLGGLILAQILQYHGVPYEIFERDTKPESRQQGWAVVLLDALAELQKELPPNVAKDLITISVNHNTEQHDELAFVNGMNGEAVAKLGGVPLGTPGGFIRASRERLRAYLWKTNDIPVQTGKQFSHQEVDDKGVTAFFADGTTARGTLLVGANGINSKVLDSVIGAEAHKMVYSVFQPLFAEVTLPEEIFQPVRELSASTLLVGSPGVRVQIGLLGMADDHKTARYFWAATPRRENPDEFAAWISKSTKEEQWELIMELTKDWAPVLTNLLKYGGSDQLASPQPKFLEFVPPDQIPGGRVAVLGDAAHAMIPFRGAGLNCAALDACDLSKLLVEAHKAGRDYSTVTAAYNEKMIPRGRDAVLSSRAAGGSEEDPVGAWSRQFGGWLRK